MLKQRAAKYLSKRYSLKTIIIFIMTENSTQFWQNQTDQKFWYDFYEKGQQEQLALIIAEWGNSTVQLKHWLNTFYSQDNINEYSVNKEAGINVNYILPPLKNRFWTGDEAIWRLKLAMQAKLIIISYIEQQNLIKPVFIVECFRLWLRIDSRYTKFTWEQFRDMVNETYEYVSNNFQEALESSISVSNDFKPKKKQTMYHYKESDFWIVTEDDTLCEAFERWKLYVYPTLLDNFKRLKIKEFQVSLANIPESKRANAYSKFKADLDLVKIKELNELSFRMQLKKFNIKYKKQY